VPLPHKVKKQLKIILLGAYLMFLQQIIGLINLAVLAISFFYISPDLLHIWYGPIICSLLIATYIWFLNYQQHKAIIKSLLYVPSGTHKEFFERIIQSCNIAKEKIQLKYAYSAEQIALTLGSTIVIDPVLWSLCDHDAQTVPVISVFTTNIEPSLTQAQKQRLSEVKKILTPQVQTFIFKHELGHVVHNFAYKKLWIIFGLGFTAAYFGIKTTQLLFAFNKAMAILLGIIVAGIIDLVLTYASNFVFKQQTEKNADIFAAQYSSANEINAAALFFAKHQEILDQNPDAPNFFTKLPTEIKTGHPNGKVRAKYLKLLAEQKNETF
jgi:Zn-dependent protease with chaperone function